MKTLEKIFSVKNDSRGTHKIITVAGAKVKVRRGGIKRLKENFTYFLDKNNPLYHDRIQDGFLRLLLTHKCNAKCDFCPHWKWSEEKLKQELSYDFIFEQCKPLYKKVKMLSLCGGEVTIYKHALELGEFVNKNYKQITIVTESNGINWNSKWQEMASEGLWTTNFSLNAATLETYLNCCWKEPGGAIAWEKTSKNVSDYIEMLKRKNRLVFAPGVSMVVNKNSVHEVLAFAKKALELKARKITYFFDTQENCLKQGFKHSELMLPALKTMIELERVLAKKVVVFFRLWVPSVNLDELQKEVDSVPIDELREKYAEILELAKDRDVLNEHNERNRIRKENGKKPLDFNQDFNATLRRIPINEKMVCFAPWQHIDIMADGSLSFCGWARNRKDLKYCYNKKGNIDWDKTLNSKPYILYRKNHYNGNFEGCQPVCPMNEDTYPIQDYHKYGFNREVE